MMGLQCEHGRHAAVVCPVCELESQLAAATERAKKAESYEADAILFRGERDAAIARAEKAELEARQAKDRIHKAVPDYPWGDASDHLCEAVYAIISALEGTEMANDDLKADNDRLRKAVDNMIPLAQTLCQQFGNHPRIRAWARDIESARAALKPTSGEAAIAV